LAFFFPCRESVLPLEREIDRQRQGNGIKREKEADGGVHPKRRGSEKNLRA